MTETKHNVTSILLGMTRIAGLSATLFLDPDVNNLEVPATTTGISCLLVVFFAYFAYQNVKKATIMKNGNVLEQHSASVNTVRSCGKTNLVASGSDDMSIVAFNRDSLKTEFIFNEHKGWITSLCVSNTGHRIVSVSVENYVCMLDTAKPKKSMYSKYTSHSSTVKTVVFNEDASCFATASMDGTLKLMKTDSGTLIETIKNEKSVGFVSACFMNNLLASGSVNGNLQIWNLKDFTCLQTLKSHEDIINCICVNVCCSVAASCSNDKTICIYDISLEKQVTRSHTLRGHSGNVMDIAFNSDCTLLASASEDKSIRIFDTTSWDCIQIFKGHTKTVTGVCFTGKFNLVSSSRYRLLINLIITQLTNTNRISYSCKTPKHSQGTVPCDSGIQVVSMASIHSPLMQKSKSAK